MSAVAKLLAELSRRGVAVLVDGEMLRLRPSAALDAGLLAHVKAHKSEILAALSAPPFDKKTPLHTELEFEEWRDPYARRLQVALSEICRPDYPTGMIQWLGEHHLDLYAKLTEKLPEEIHRLWTEHRPLDEFDYVLGLWSEAHRAACRLFRATRKPDQASSDTKKMVKRNDFT